jgi:hypothetical protein
MVELRVLSQIARVVSGPVFGLGTDCFLSLMSMPKDEKEKEYRTCY